VDGKRATKIEEQTNDCNDTTGFVSFFSSIQVFAQLVSLRTIHANPIVIMKVESRDGVVEDFYRDNASDVFCDQVAVVTMRSHTSTHYNYNKHLG
jgi:hypothetical protein